jgi:hypothetical protein
VRLNDTTIMKHLLCTLLLSLLAALPAVHAADAAAVKIAVGMDHTDAIALLKKHGAEDITPNLAIIGPNGEHPLKGYVWALRDYGIIIEVNDKDNKVSSLIYNTTTDFAVSKEHRARMEQTVTSITLDPKTKAASIEKAPNVAN